MRLLSLEEVEDHLDYCSLPPIKSEPDFIFLSLVGILEFLSNFEMYPLASDSVYPFLAPLDGEGVDIVTMNLGVVSYFLDHFCKILKLLNFIESSHGELMDICITICHLINLGHIFDEGVDDKFSWLEGQDSQCVRVEWIEGTLMNFPEMIQTFYLSQILEYR